MNTTRRGRPKDPGTPYPDAAAAGRGRSSSSEWNALQRETDAASLKEALEGPFQTEVADLEGTEGLRRKALAQEARADLTTILAETTKSKNLKRTVVKLIKKAVRKMEGGREKEREKEKTTEAARRLSEDDLADLEAEVKALRGSSTMAKDKAQVTLLPGSTDLQAG